MIFKYGFIKRGFVLTGNNKVPSEIKTSIKKDTGILESLS